MNRIFGYLLLSSGPRHAADATKLRAARKQMCALTECAEKQNANLEIVAWDYARQIHGRDDLPNLFKFLKACRGRHLANNSKPLLVMDDYNRLFRVAKLAVKEELWADLLEYSDHLVDLYQRKPLHAISTELLRLVKFGSLAAAKTKRIKDTRPREERSAQTHKARQVSAVARHQAALRCAKELRAGSHGNCFKGAETCLPSPPIFLG